MHLRDLFKNILGAAAEPDADKRKAEVAKIAKALDTPGSPEHEAAESHAIQTLSNLHPDHVKNLKAQHETLGKMIGEYGEGPHPDGHPVHAMKTMHEHLGKMLAGCEPEGDQMGEADVQKEVEKAVTSRTAALEKRVKDAETALQVEVEKRLDGEMTVLLKSFKTIPFDMDKDVARFRKMKQSDPETYERTMSLLKAAEEQNKQSALFQKNFGTGRTGSGGAHEKLDGKAQEIMKRDTKLTKEQAFDQACLENPSLVAEYRKEMQ